MRTPDAAMRNSRMDLGRFSKMTTTIAGLVDTSVKCNLKMPGTSRFSKTARYRVPSTLTRRLWLT
jgi:hypothetical protein